MTKKILVFKLGAIGDALMTTPFVRQLRSQYPKAKIDYLIGKHAQFALKNNPHINQLISINESIFYKKKKILLISLLVSLFFKRYHRIYILHRDKYFYLYLSFLFIPIVGFRNGFLFQKDNFDAKNEDTHSEHHVYKYLNLIPNYDFKDFQLEMNSPLASQNKFLTTQEIKIKNEIKKIFQKDKINIFLNTGGGSNPGEKTTVRQWGKNKFIELILNIQKHKKWKNKIHFYLVGDKHDSVLNNQIQKTTLIEESKANNVFDVTAKWNLLTFSFALKFANIFITGDTGGMHLASALKIPILSIFGPTAPEEKKPLGNQHHCVSTNANCSPCYFGKFKGCDNFICMPSISVDMVWKKLQKMLTLINKE